MLELNRIYNMDCLEGMKRIPDKSIDLIVTDPPYLHVKGGMKSKRFNVGRVWSADSRMVNEMSDFDKKEIFKFLDASLRVLKKANMYIFCSKLQLIHYFEYISEYNANVPKSMALKYDLLIWDKLDNRMMSSKFHASDIEYIVRIYESGVSLNKVWDEEGKKSDSSHYMKLQSFKKPDGEHITQKPVELIKRLIRISSRENDLVLDPFMGSGTTAIACLNTDRQYIGFELDETYHKLSLERISETTSNQIELPEIERNVPQRQSDWLDELLGGE